MRKLLTVFFLALSFVSFSQYNPSIHTGLNKPIGLTNMPDGARCYLYDGTNFRYRPFISTAEALSYFPQGVAATSARKGHFSIIINTGGTLSAGIITGGTNAEYWFKDGIADVNLVKKADLTLEYANSHFLSTIAGQDYNALANIPTFKTINGNTITGSGNIVVTSGGNNISNRGNVRPTVLSDSTDLNLYFNGTLSNVDARPLTDTTLTVRKDFPQKFTYDGINQKPSNLDAQFFYNIQNQKVIANYGTSISWGAAATSWDSSWVALYYRKIQDYYGMPHDYPIWCDFSTPRSNWNFINSHKRDDLYGPCQRSVTSLNNDFGITTTGRVAKIVIWIQNGVVGSKVKRYMDGTLYRTDTIKTKEAHSLIDSSGNGFTPDSTASHVYTTLIDSGNTLIAYGAILNVDNTKPDFIDFAVSGSTANFYNPNIKIMAAMTGSKSNQKGLMIGEGGENDQNVAPTLDYYYNAMVTNFNGLLANAWDLVFISDHADNPADHGNFGYADRVKQEIRACRHLGVPFGDQSNINYFTNNWVNNSNDFHPNNDGMRKGYLRMAVYLVGSADKFGYGSGASAASATTGGLSDYDKARTVTYEGTLGDADDLNTFQTTGRWFRRLNNLTNGAAQHYPGAGWAGVLDVKRDIDYAGVKMAYQYYHTFQADNNYYFRAFYDNGSGGTWSSWVSASYTPPAAAALINDADDLNTYVHTGNFYMPNNTAPSTGKNYPSGGTYAGKLRVDSAYGFIFQHYTPYGAFGTTEFVRSNYGGSWFTWGQMVNQATLDTSIFMRVNADLGNSTDLNTIFQNGYQFQNANNDAHVSNHYPVEGVAGMLTTTNRNGFIHQTYSSFGGVSDSLYQVWFRDSYSGTWRPWKRQISYNSDGTLTLNVPTVTGATYGLVRTSSGIGQQLLNQPKPVFIYNISNLTGTTGSTVYTIANANPTLYNIGQIVKIKSGSGSVAIVCSYTDEEGTNRTYTFTTAQNAFASPLTGVGTYNLGDTKINCGGGTNITFTYTVVGTITYNVYSFAKEEGTLIF